MQSFPGEEAAFFHASSSWSESEGQSHLGILWGNRSREGDGALRDCWGRAGVVGCRGQTGGAGA